MRMPNLVKALFIVFSCFLNYDAEASSSGNSNISNGSLRKDVASAIHVLELASASITGFQPATEILPFATISYAQTIDGSM